MFVNYMKNFNPFKSFTCKGFSLPEIMLATSIAAMGIITILGLLPHGLNNMRKAGDITATSRISQQILSDSNQLQNTIKQRLYFDTYGVSKDINDVYKHTIAYVAEIDPPIKDIYLPGSKINDSVLFRIKVKIKQTNDINYNFNEIHTDDYRLYSYVIANTRK